MSFIINDEKWAEELQEGLDEYIDGIQNWYVYGDEEGEEPEILSGQPYCGCMTCYWREVLFFVSPKIMAGQNEGKIELDGA